MDKALKEAILKRIHSVPIVDYLKMDIVEISDGYCESKVPRQKNYDGIFESFHGGLLMTVADTTACWAILTKTGADAQMATTDMNIRFLAPCLSDVTAKARLIKFGKTMCPVSVDLYDGKGKLVAVSQVNYMVFKKGSKRE